MSQEGKGVLEVQASTVTAHLVEVGGAGRLDSQFVAVTTYVGTAAVEDGPFEDEEVGGEEPLACHASGTVHDVVVVVEDVDGALRGPAILFNATLVEVGHGAATSILEVWMDDDSIWHATVVERKNDRKSTLT